MRAVVLGGGYAGITVTSRLEKWLPADAEIVLIDQGGTHVIRHELHRVIRQPELGKRIRIPLSSIVNRAGILERTVTSIETDDQTLTFENGEQLEYDAAAICLGSTPAYYGIDGLRDHSLTLHNLGQAREIGDRARSITNRGEGDIVIGGAGLTGIQVAGELAEMTATEAADISITLIEMADTIAPASGSRFQEATHQALTEKGVTIHTNTRIAGLTDQEVLFPERESMPTDLFIWTGGISGPEPFDGDRPLVRADLQYDEHTFVAGDAARIVDVNGDMAPASAQTAIRQAPIVARNMERVLTAAEQPREFRPRLDRYQYESPGWAVSVGDDAVAQVGSRILRGRAAKGVKTLVGVGYLTSAGAIYNAIDLVRMEFSQSSIEDRM